LFAAETNPSPENPVLAPASDAGSNPRPEVEPPPQPSPADSFLQSMAHLIGVVEERFHGLPDWEKVYDGAAAGFVRALGDRHTEYLTPAEHAAWIAEQNGEQANVGLVLRARRNGPMEILAVLPGTPAAEAGLQRGDRIVAVDGRSVTDDWFDGKPFLSGELGSKLSLKVVRASEPERDVELTRRNVHRPVGFAKRLRGGIGYLHLREFRGIGEEEFELLNTLLEGEPLKGLVLDLRFNPGGTMRSAANLAALFLEPRTRILGLHYRHKPDESVSVDHGGELRELPLVILLNGHSASASEVLAGALQDHGRARVIGTRSRGKGSSQSVYPLTRGAVKLTVALWSTPNGRRIQRQESGEGGILPDVVVNADDNEGLPLANRLLLGSAGLPDKDRRPDPALRAALAALKP
ncbi:MAG TPA: S41 family peptidase, partial [Elusimicrobiota bacterium]|nr:S41 family peptidase [Elusimicrobiota bacterium]